MEFHTSSPHNICWLRHISLKKIGRIEPAWEPCRPIESWMVSTVGQMFTLTPSGCLGGNVHEGTKPKGKSVLPGSGTFWAQSSLHQERTQPALGQVWTHLDGVISGSNVVFVPGTSTDRLLPISPNGTWWHKVPGSKLHSPTTPKALGTVEAQQELRH